MNLFSEFTTLLLENVFRGIYQTNNTQLQQRPSKLCSKQCEDEVINPSAWGHLIPSSYCDVGRFFYRVFKF